MRITTSDNFKHGWNCRVSGCERHYCSEHRMLWRDCDTAIVDFDGSGRLWWGLRDCPVCEIEERQKKISRREANYGSQNAA